MCEGYGLGLAAFLFTVVLIAVVVPFSKYHDVEHCDLITDIWIEQEAHLFRGNTEVFVFELNDNETVEVSSFEYYNHNVGDMYCRNVQVGDEERTILQRLLDDA